MFYHLKVTEIIKGCKITNLVTKSRDTDHAHLVRACPKIFLRGVKGNLFSKFGENRSRHNLVHRRRTDTGRTQEDAVYMLYIPLDRQKCSLERQLGSQCFLRTL